MSEPRIIKKYPNRRLYDTSISSYVTLEDVRRLVLEGVEFRVVDARSGEDITRNVLLQIISEQEEKGQPIFTTTLLEQLIRFYDDALQGMISKHLEQSMELFIKQQDVLREQMRSMMDTPVLSLMGEITERNLALWKQMQDSFFKAATPREKPGSAKAEATEQGEAKKPR